MRNLHDLIEKSNERELRELFQGALLPKESPSFAKTLQRAKERPRLAPTRMIAALAGVVLVLGGGWLYASLGAPTPISETVLQPVKPSPAEVGVATSTPSAKAAPASGPTTTPAPTSLTTKTQSGQIVINTYPLIGLWVFIDGEDTELKTPITRALSLSPGKHTAMFIDEEGKRYGSFPFEVTANETTRWVFQIKKDPTDPKSATQKTPKSTPPTQEEKIGDKPLPNPFGERPIRKDEIPQNPFGAKPPPAKEPKAKKKDGSDCCILNPFGTNK